ncbi:glutamine synthetase III [Halobacteriovorax marinus]|uniref:glutamine synthetase III family protein n=1 Tax=Halobacteriovorax marinus TaxID=97084 RepID=UPI000BDE9B50|nr:glutamine synthetase III [Halobacteriovorax marinus]
MPSKYSRIEAKKFAINRKERTFKRPVDLNGNFQKVSEYYGENVFHYLTAPGIPESIKNELLTVSNSGNKLKKEHADIVAKAVTEWATSKGATHFCHWFQPLTGSTAEKHDAFLDLDGELPIEKLSAGQLMQGEPDASSFPNGGARSTFEARGYTSWDLTSPMFLMDGVNGKTLCIPTAFVSYHGDALDMKTPLLRSVTRLNDVATKFMNLIGFTDTKKVSVTCGAEQEYFLVDKAFYFSRPDLVMTGRTLLGSLSHKNQQLDDHYFGRIPERVLSCMEEIDYELHRLGIPAKTRHNEVAPGQFEIAQIFREANVSADNNQLVMAVIKEVAEKHNFIALLHEKPFAGINGSGKHINWSMATDDGMNLLEPGNKPEKNIKFLAVTSIVIEAVYRRAKLLRMAISSQGNDHRLGANEAPPSIISVFTGSNLEKIFEAIKNGETVSEEGKVVLDLGANQLANLMMDNTDRNRTSPFAFTGNKFEFRAVGSSQSISFPLSILNAAVTEVFEESIEFLEKEIKASSVETALMKLTKKWLQSSWNIIFNGDGYSQEWVEEAKKRGLPNLRTTADALGALLDDEQTKYMVEKGIFRKNELQMRYNVLVENYNTLREIEFQTQMDIVKKNVLPATLEYKKRLGKVIKVQKEIGLESSVEVEMYKKLNFTVESLYANLMNLTSACSALNGDAAKNSLEIANNIFPLSEKLAQSCNEVEDLIPNELWPLPTYYEMLFLR